MRTQLRIVAGSLRGRKVTCTVDPHLRPTPQMVREALFSILGNAVPDRPFFDVFAGTGVVGLEALSRGASSATFVERDFRVAAGIQQHLQEFGVGERATLVRADVYRWAERWQPPPEPVNVFLSPPFGDFERRPEELLGVIELILHKVEDGSVLVVQSERHAAFDELLPPEGWDRRRYGRNELLIKVKGEAEHPDDSDEEDAEP
jgi:16S rRNA (guanine(966)-N(2))-methyltransferase RsmD